MHSSVRVWIVCLILAFGIAAPNIAKAAAIPPPLFIKILLAAVAFDRSVAENPEPVIRIGVAGTSGQAKAISKTLQAASSKKIKGKSIELVDVTATDFASKKPHVVIFADALGGSAASTGKNCQSAKVLCASSDAADVEAGLALGVEMAGGKPKLVINLPSATAAGADFSAQILRLARVIK